MTVGDLIAELQQYGSSMEIVEQGPCELYEFNSSIGTSTEFSKDYTLYDSGRVIKAGTEVFIITYNG